MAKTRRTPWPKTAKPLVKTKPTPAETAETAKTATIATTETTETKKGGRHPDNKSFYDHLGDLFFPETNSDPINHALSAYSGPVSFAVFQSLSNVHEVPREMFETFNAGVDPVTGSCERHTCSYENDDLLRKFLDATPQQVQRMWEWFDLKVDACHKEDHIRDIRNRNDKEHNRLFLFKVQLVDLKNGEWLSNSIIGVFHWKFIDVLSKLGVKDVYKRFKFMDSGFMYYMFLAK
jgi:hypothetical protein